MTGSPDPDAGVVTARLEHRWGNVPAAALEAVATASVTVASSLLADPRRADDAGRVLGSGDGRSVGPRFARDSAPRGGRGDTSRSAVKQWEWTPATKDGVKVKTWIVVPIPFVIK